MLVRYFARKHTWAGIMILAAAAVCVGQPAPSQATRPHVHKAHEGAAKTTPAVDSANPGAAAQPQKPLSPMEQPPQPAIVTLSGGKLSVKADNSSLIQIIDQLGKSSGMSITGLSADQRVFGDYGPGDPSQILSELLEGAGYNVLMTGLTPKGTPRKLLLSLQGDAPPSSPQSFPQPENFPEPVYQRQPAPPPPAGNLNFPVRSPSQMYQQMMQQRQEQQQQQPQ